MGERPINRKEPRPPIRVEALPPRWAQLTRLVSQVSVGRQASPGAVASAWPSARRDHPKGSIERKSEISRTKLGYPSQPIPSATTIPPIGRCANGSKPRVSLDLPAPVYQLLSTCASSFGTLFLLYLRAVSFRTTGFSTAPRHRRAWQHGVEAEKGQTAIPAGPSSRPSSRYLPGPERSRTIVKVAGREAPVSKGLRIGREGSAAAAQSQGFDGRRAGAQSKHQYQRRNKT
jgi:hypothetical protein